MTREQLESLFDEQDFTETSGLYEDRETYIDLDNVKKYVFNELIPKALVSILGTESSSFSVNGGPKLKNSYGDTDFIGVNEIKQKAKELGFII